MEMEQTKEYIERLVRIEERIISLNQLFEERIVALNQRFDDVVVSQLKDHGKRIAAVEGRITELESEKAVTAKDTEKRFADLEESVYSGNKKKFFQAGGFVAGGGALGAIIEWLARNVF